MKLKFISLLIIVFSVVEYSFAQTPVANFTANDTDGCGLLVVRFTDLSTNIPTSWDWNFGDGSAHSYIKNPVHAYFNTGTFTVSLIATNASGSNTKTKTNYIVVHVPPTVNFSANIFSGCAPLVVNFTNLSIQGEAPITGIQWDFGDGNSSAQPNPTHIYTNTGTYNVTLTITDANGCVKTLVKTNYITVSLMPIVSFTSSQPIACTAPLTVTFTNTSTNGNTYNWNFGDGSTSNSVSPVHTYTTAGNFTVRLIVTAASGCSDTLIMTDYIKINTFKADFSANPVIGCSPLTVNFSDSTIGAVTWTWDFGEGPVNLTQNPSHQYNSTGTYTVKLVVLNSIGCKDSLIRVNYIIVNTGPVVNYSANDTTACNAPFTVNFIDNTPGGVKWIWNFGDGSPTDTTQNPSHTYLTTGSFNVSLTVTDISGCSGTLTINNFIEISSPIVGFIADTVMGCISLPVDFTDTSISITPITGWQWNFGDGSPIGTTNPINHIYNVTGTFDVTLTVTDSRGCTSVLTKTAFIRTGTPPVVDFSAIPLMACRPDTIRFTDLSTPAGNINSWNWTFGDGGISNQQNPAYTYGDTGTFTVRLTVSFNGCADSTKKINYIHISPPKAEFNVNNGCDTPFVAIFVNTSQAADSCIWRFGDGSPDSATGPPIHPYDSIIHTYNNVGTYVVWLKVFNDSTGCVDSTSQTVRISKIVPNYTISSPSSCQYDSITFTDVSTSPVFPITGRIWYFGDGQTDTLSNPVSHVYAASGPYTVKLVVTNGVCTDSISILQNIIIRDLPSPKFTGTFPLTGCAPLTVIFRDSSTAVPPAIVSLWIWNFGDGTIDTNIAGGVKTHVYNTRGTYTVSLRVIDSTGCDSTQVYTNYVVVTHPYAGFTVNPVTCSGNAVSFTNTSTGTNLNYTWNFGDGITSATTVSPVTHVYSPTITTTYSVSLTAVDLNGCDSTFVDTVKISKPVADFGADSLIAGCPPFTTNFFDSSSVDVTTWSWDFGDGTTPSTQQNPIHTFVDAGSYTVRLIVTNADGCKDTLTRPDYIFVDGPDGTFTFTPTSGCAPFTVTFTATATNTDLYEWVFGDGATTIGNPVTHTYTVGNTYTPVLVLYDYTNISGDTCIVNIVSPQTLLVNNATVDFTADKVFSCHDTTIQFADMTDAFPAVTAWHWYFGDGDSSNLQHPSHYYGTVGTYTVTLTVEINGCLYTLTRPSYIVISSTPDANFYINPDYVIVNNNIAFIDSSLGIVNIWSWDFGDGTKSSLQNPFHAFQTSGTYRVTLTVSTSDGCSDTYIKEIVVDLQIPNAFTPDGDGINDVFLKNQPLIIINRWGQTLYEGAEGWDGTYDGKEVLPGTYFYILTLKDAENNPRKVYGSVTLIRKK
ncbi:MAG: PKD domain-containing protein [Bacteroidales bacterium]|nr:PKD domain-containing protein [Bacteroidales bacterium]